MALFPCAIPACTEKALVGPLDVYTICRACGRRFCGLHYDDTYHHKCARKDKERRHELDYLQHAYLAVGAQRELDLPAYLAEAMALRPPYSCTGPRELVRKLEHCMRPDKPVTIFEGAYHWNIFITFDDGVKWVVRIAQIDHTNPPRPALRMTTASEYVTLCAMNTAGIKVPRAWPSRGLMSGYDGLPYFFTEFIDGSFYGPFVGREQRARPPSEVDEQHIRCLAEFFITVSGLSFESVGSLHRDEDGSLRVGPAVAATAILPEHPWFLGPFRSAREYYLAQIDTAIEQTLAGLRHLAYRAVDGFIIYKVLRKLVETCPEMESGPWYIRAVDDKGDRYFFKDGEMTGVIDWEWAFLTCKGEAFAGPRCLLNPDYYLGSNELTAWELSLANAYEDLGRGDLAECVRRGKKFQRLRDLLEFDIQEVEHLHALYRAFVESDLTSADTEPQTVAEWAGIAARRFPDISISDKDLAMLRQRAAVATLLPDTELPDDSDSEREDEESQIGSLQGSQKDESEDPQSESENPLSDR